MLRFTACAILVATCSACAVADNTPGAVTYHDTGTSKDAKSETDGSPLSDSEPTDSTSTDSGRNDSAPGDTGSGDTSGDTSGDVVIDDSSSDTPIGDGSGPPCTPTTKAMCSSSAAPISPVSGDTGKDVSTASGSDGEWLRVDVTENDSSIFGHAVSVRFTLTSPPGENFDLFVYEGPTAASGGGFECSTVSGSSTTSGVDTVRVTWSDTLASDDSKTVSVEVRPASPVCDPSQKWTLKVEGDV